MKYLRSIFILLVVTGSAFGQCPKFSEIEKKLKAIKSETDLKKNKTEIITLIQWDNQWRNCNFPIDSLYGILSYRIAENLFMSQNFNEALKKFNQSQEIFKKHDTKISYLPKTYSLIGRCQYHLEQNKEAKENITESIRLSNNSKYFIILSQNYLHLSSIYYEEGDYQLAIQNLDKGIEIAKKSNNYMMIANAENQKATINNYLGNFDFALNSAFSALKSASLSKDKELIARQYQMIGRIYSNKKQLNDAIENFQKAIDILGQINLTVSTSLQINIGFLYLTKVKDYDKSLVYFKKALSTVDDSYQKLRIYNNIGYAYSQKKDFQNAIVNYQKGFQAIDLKFNPNNISENPSSQLIKRASNKEYLLSLIIDKAESWLDFHNYQNSKSSINNALQTYLSVDKMIDYMRWEHKGNESKLFWRKKTRSIYENAIKTCYLLKDYEKAFYFFEKSRAVLLNDKLNELGAKQSLSEQDKKKENELQSKVDELRKKITENKNEIEKSEKELFLAENEQEKFIKSLETKNPAYFRLKYDTVVVSLKQFQTHLAATKSTAVEYFMGDSAAYAIVISPNSVSLKKLNYNAINTQRFLEFCSKDINTKAELSQFLAVSSDIYKSLIQPLSLPKGRLIISQDGAFLPFEALSKSAINSEYLLNKYAISYTYSAQFLLKNTQKTTFLTQNKFLGIAPVNFVQKLSPLNGSVESLDKIAKNYFWSSKFVEQQGNKKAFLENAKNHQIVQIYTHAFADSNATEPRIYFADSTLQVSELGLEQQFKTNLLVLSACKTGVGKVAKGEGVLSLARGFSMVGIPATITSLWSIEDKDTYKLTELFYQYLNQGLPKDEALQKAKIDFISSNENPMPNTWAGMILIGDSSAISSDYWYVWLLAGFILMIIATGIWYWRKKIRPLPFKQRL